MKLLMLCREPRLYSCQRLQQAAASGGHQMDIFDPNRCLLKLSVNPPHFQLYYQANRNADPILLDKYDAVLPRFGTSSTKMGCAVLQHFAAQRIYCLNHANAFALARDKWQSLQLLLQNGIPVPSSFLSGCEFTAENAVRTATKSAVQNNVEQAESSLILKTLSGSQGIGVMLTEKPQSAVSLLETLTQAQISVLLQDFIAEADGADIRCFVIGEQVVATMQRKGQSGEFRANCHRGGVTEKIQLTQQEKQIAINATKAIGLDVAGVDLIRSKQGVLVLEVNASPGLEMIEKTSGIDIATQMISFIERKVTESVNIL